MLQQAKSSKLQRVLSPTKLQGGIPGVVVQAAATARPEIFKDTFQQCILDRAFLKQWKNMKLVLLLEAKGPTNSAGRFRPLCLLYIVGWLFKRILFTHKKLITESANGLQGHQYSLRKEKSTLDAPTAVRDTAENALDGAW